MVTLFENSKAWLPQFSVHESPMAQGPFEFGRPLVVPRGTQRNERDIGFERASASLYGIIGHDGNPPVALTPALPRNEVGSELLNSTLELTFSGTGPVAHMTYACAPEPTQIFPPTSFDSRKLPPEPASTNKVSTGTQINRHWSCPQESHEGWPTSALYQCHRRDASTDPSSYFQLAAVDPCPQPGAPALQMLLDLVDSQQKEKADDDSSAETLFDGILESWDCLVKRVCCNTWHLRRLPNS